METETRYKCTQCKVNLPESHFGDRKRNGDMYKQCIKCREMKKRSSDKNKCIHENRKAYCKKCLSEGIECSGRRR